MNSDWTKTTLGDVATYINGYPFKPEDLGPEGLPVIRIKQLLDPEEPVDRSLTEVPERCHLKDGDLVFSWSGTLAARLWDRGPALLNQHLFRVIEAQGVNQRWLRYALDLAIDDLSSKMHGTTMKHVTKSNLLPHSVLLPPLSVQRRIVDLIGVVDEATEAADLYVSRVEATLSSAATEFLQRPTLQMALGDAAEVTIGRQRSPRQATGDHMTKYLRAANVKDGRLVLDDVLEMNFTPTERETFGLEFGDVLVSEGCGSLAQLGASASWHADLAGPVCFQNTLLRLRAKEGLTTSGYLDHLARHAFHSGWWARIASGTNIFHIGLKRAKQLPVPVPSVDEQEKATQLLDSLGDVLVEARSYRASLTGLRTALLDDLLSGKHEIPESYEDLLRA